MKIERNVRLRISERLYEAFYYGIIILSVVYDPPLYTRIK